MALSTLHTHARHLARLIVCWVGSRRCSNGCGSLREPIPWRRPPTTLLTQLLLLLLLLLT